MTDQHAPTSTPPSDPEGRPGATRTEPSWSDKLSRRALFVGVGALLLCGVGVATSGKDQFFQSYLIGFTFWFGIAMGCLGLQMIHALTGGRWGVAIRRQMYAASTTLPALGVLFVPLLFGLEALYPWARPEAATDTIIQHKAIYLNEPFFIGRAVALFVIWSTLALWLYRRSVRRGLHKSPSRRMRIISGPGLLICAITVTVAAIDWLMSLDPHWFSTMFGAIVMAGAMLSGMAFVVVMLIVDAKRRGVAVPIDPLHALGNLLLVFVMIWGYFAYSQYLIIYAGNMAEDAPWYVHRSELGWQYMSLVVILLHFAVPFMILLSRRSKRSPKVVGSVAAAVLLMRLVESFWVAAPNFNHHLTVHWLDVVTPIAIGGLWLAYFFHRFGRPELRPVEAAS